MLHGLCAFFSATFVLLDENMFASIIICLLVEIKQTNPVGGKINVSLNGGKGCTVKIKLKKAINTQVTSSPASKLGPFETTTHRLNSNLEINSEIFSSTMQLV